MERFERWASYLFGVLLLLDLFIVLTAIGASDQPPGARLVVTAGLIVGAIALYAAIVALARSRPWANAVAVMILGLVVVSGVVDAMANLSTRLTVPVAAIAAVIVLLQRPPTRESLALSRRAVAPLAIVAAFLVAAVWSPISAAALQPGGSPFSVRPTALAVAVKLDCRTTAADGTIVATISWAWRERDLLPGSVDGLFVRWAQTPDAGGTIVEQASTTSAGVWAGDGSPAATLIQPLEQSGGGGAFTSFGIDVAGHGQTDGSVQLVLRAEGIDGGGSIRVAAAYAHLDRWLRWSDDATCTW